MFHVNHIHNEHERKPGHKTWIHVNVDTLILVQHLQSVLHETGQIDINYL